MKKENLVSNSTQQIINEISKTLRELLSHRRKDGTEFIAANRKMDNCEHIRIPPNSSNVDFV